MFPGETTRLKKGSLPIVAGEKWLRGHYRDGSAPSTHRENFLGKRESEALLFSFRVIFHLVELFVSKIRGRE